MGTARLRTIVAAASIAVLAGCGAQPNQTHPANTWASSYCSALNGWLTTMDDLSRGFVIEPTQTATTNITDLETMAKQVSQASGTLTDALARAGRPQTPGGARVERAIVRLSAEVKSRSEAASRAAKSNARSALAGFRRLQAFTTAVDGTLADILIADANIRAGDVALRRALSGAHACTDFHDNVRNGTRRGDQ